ncbi:hypothetical protein [Catellatospora sp. NPDC049609]|uniref:hypothetical protein n=1 Tax=Catellatospora sp. NPDC049609 TaxID=3155505 RepID=UPI003426BFF8
MSHLQIEKFTDIAVRYVSTLKVVYVVLAHGEETSQRCCSWQAGGPDAVTRAQAICAGTNQIQRIVMARHLLASGPA